MDAECVWSLQKKHSVQYTGITRLSIDRKGNLRLYEGWHQRVFHPSGEWKWLTPLIASMVEVGLTTDLHAIAPTINEAL